MSATVDHKVEMFRLANQRRREGKPLWEETIDVSSVFHNDDLTFEQKRDSIAASLRSSRWANKLADDDGNCSLADLIEELAETTDVDEFDAVWEAVYDAADYGRVWIKTA